MRAQRRYLFSPVSQCGIAAWSVCVHMCLCVCLSVHVPVHVYEGVIISVCVCVCFGVYISHGDKTPDLILKGDAMQREEQGQVQRKQVT